MALIIEFIKNPKGGIKKPTETICEYNSCIVNDERIVRFSTCGSSNRKKPGNNSQILHFNKDSALEFIKILSHEFNL